MGTVCVKEGYLMGSVCVKEGVFSGISFCEGGGI